MELGRQTSIRWSKDRKRFFFSTLRARFFAKIKKTESCWLWTGSQDKAGYGKISEGQKVRSTHRVSWEIHNGTIPDGLNVLHRCDNPPCVNPAHLFLGTISDNAQDALQKGRIQTGSLSKNAKLSEVAVAAILMDRASGSTIRSIALKFGVTRRTITTIFQGKTYKSEVAAIKAAA